jgi:hypothetical protein
MSFTAIKHLLVLEFENAAISKQSFMKYKLQMSASAKIKTFKSSDNLN